MSLDLERRGHLCCATGFCLQVCRIGVRESGGEEQSQGPVLRVEHGGQWMREGLKIGERGHFAGGSLVQAVAPVGSCRGRGPGTSTSGKFSVSLQLDVNSDTASEMLWASCQAGLSCFESAQVLPGTGGEEHHGSRARLSELLWGR